ncbi:MAG TPA: LLM class F420-dependent oxidoreductase [Thermodesulfobacteriota bacterium]|nr:LLM class F420-dependent oxidoreductase [Thermodesulfobacteriota bacterium]
MKFGIALPNFGMYAEKDSILRIVRAAEELGFDSLWVSDHIVIPDSHKGFGSVFYEPLITLTYVSACTTRIHLGTSVLIMPYRNPIVLAKMLSTLDVLSNGRVILGAGVGWLKAEFAALGVPYEERGAVTDEYIEILKVLWTEEEPRFEGKLHSFSGIKFLPKPFQKPHPPIWIGGNGKIAIERAVSLGDGWHSVGLTPDEIKERVKYANELLPKKNKESDFIVSVRKNLQIKDTAAKELTTAENRETLRGRPDQIAEGIKKYGEAGVSHIVFQVLSGTLEGVIKNMEIFSKNIRPDVVNI